MKSLAGLALLAAAVFLSGNVSASPITFIDNNIFDPVISLTSGDQYDYIHNINDDGFDASLDSIVSVLLSINIEYASTSGGGNSDPADNTSSAIDCSNTGGEGTGSAGTVPIGGGATNTGSVTNTGSEPDCDSALFPIGTPLIFKVMADSETFNFLSTDGTALDMTITPVSLTDGLLNVRLFDISSNINFLSSSLTVAASRSSVVPEPSVLLLLGSGLLGLGLIRRRRLYSQ